MRKIIFALMLAVVPVAAMADRQTMNTSDKVSVWMGKANANFTDLYTNKANSSCFADSAAFNACFDLNWPTGFDVAADYTVTGAWDFTGATVTGIGGSYTLPTASSSTLGGVKVGSRLTITDGVLSADVQSGTGAVNSVNGQTGTVVLDADDIGDTSTTKKFVTAADLTKLGNTSGTNTGDQDLSVYLSKTNTTAFTPNADYHPATKKYVDDSITAGGGYTDEQAQDAVGGMFSGNTETGITVTYNDTTGKVDFVVATQSDVNFTSALNTKLAGIADGAEVNVNADWNASSGDAQILNKPTIPVFPTCTNDEDIMEWDTTTSAWVCKTLDRLVAGTGITITENGGGPGVDTVNVTHSIYQAYDADLTTWAGVTPGAGIATFLATPSGANLATALTTALPASKGGTGLTALGTGVSSALSADIGVVNGLPKIVASGTYTVDTASISANTCASAVAVTASGVTTTDTVIATPNAILSSITGFGVTTAGAVRVDIYPTSGNVNFQFCNPTGAAIDPGSVAFNWKVIR